MKQKTKLIILSILGLICTIKLAIIYYQSNYNPYAQPSFCSINGFIDCDAVASTTKAVFLGVPLSYWGLFFYSFLLMLLFVEKISSLKSLKILSVFKNPISYILLLGIFSSVISILLFITSLFIIHKICILCFLTYIINFLITATVFNIGIKSAFHQSVKDFLDGIKLYPVQFCVALLTAIIFLSYTTLQMPFASRKQSIKHFIQMKKNPYKITGNILGNKNGKIKVDIYTDYVCPYCSMYNIMLHKVVKENNQILIRHHNFPLDKACNPYIDEQMHDGACRMAKYAIAAENQGKYWEMASALFELHPKDDNKAIEIAKSLNLDIDKFKNDISSEITVKQLKTEIDDAIFVGIDGTPIIVVNQKIHTGIKPYYEFKKIIEGK